MTESAVSSVPVSPEGPAQAPVHAPLTGAQRAAILASYLGWTLDAFDFFLMVFLLKSIAETFHADAHFLKRRQVLLHPIAVARTELKRQRY